MIDYSRLEQQLTDALALPRRPVAIAARQHAPANVPAFSGSMPSGCSFWRLAAEGRVFSTVPSDHYNCPVGSHTHRIALPPERAHELSDVLSLMSQVGYIRMEEVPAIPQLPETPAVVVYAPLGETPVDPDAVIVAGIPGRLMLVNEAATRSGTALQPFFGRPTCMAIPAALGHGVVSSTGCIGNRIYTDLPDSEMYTVIAGDQVAAITDALTHITGANAALTEYHQARRAALTA